MSSSRFSRLRPGTKGWIGVVLYVIAFDVLSSETMSAAFADAVKHPRRRWPVLAAWAALTGHLFVIIPEHLDPLRCIARRFGK